MWYNCATEYYRSVGINDMEVHVSAGRKLESLIISENVGCRIIQSISFYNAWKKQKHYILFIDKYIHSKKHRYAMYKPNFRILINSVEGGKEGNVIWGRFKGASTLFVICSL